MPLYFAYGSNLSSARMRQPARAPFARFVGTASVSGHVLSWHKRGADGTGKCTIRQTGQRGDGVWGVVWEVEEADVARLDAIEGPGYQRIPIEVVSANQRMEAFTYVARETHVDAALTPASWYRGIVLSGAREHGLPAAWIRTLEGSVAPAPGKGAETSSAPTPEPPKTPREQP